MYRFLGFGRRTKLTLLWPTIVSSTWSRIEYINTKLRIRTSALNNADDYNSAGKQQGAD